MNTEYRCAVIVSGDSVWSCHVETETLEMAKIVADEQFKKCLTNYRNSKNIDVTELNRLEAVHKMAMQKGYFITATQCREKLVET